MSPRVVVIVGATGTGKSALSVRLAHALSAAGNPAEIVNADAMQLYRGMDIGTAKTPVAERGGIPHHLLDVLDPREEASAAYYQDAARTAIEQIQARGSTPILVGGSGLYVSSVIYDFQFPGTDVDIRLRLEQELADVGTAVLHARLAARDPVAARAIGPHNARRIVRALEVVEITGKPFGAGLAAENTPWRPAVILGVRAPRAQLVARLDDRVRAMWAGGIVEEATALAAHGLGITASRAIGYAQALAQSAGTLSREEAIDQASGLTRRYARRQVSWFRRDRSTHWLDHDDPGLDWAALGAATSATVRET